jgi:hypothetical protein
VESAADYVEPMRTPEPPPYTEPERPVAEERFERAAPPSEVWSPPPEPPSYRDEPRDDAAPAASPEPSAPSGDERQPS